MSYVPYERARLRLEAFHLLKGYRKEEEYTSHEMSVRERMEEAVKLAAWAFEGDPLSDENIKLQHLKADAAIVLTQLLNKGALTLFQASAKLLAEYIRDLPLK